MSSWMDPACPHGLDHVSLHDIAFLLPARETNAETHAGVQ